MEWPWIILAALGVGLSGFVSACEMGLYCINTVRLELGRRSGHWRSAVLSRLLIDRPGLITALMVANNLADYVATACVVYLFVRFGLHEQKAELYTTLILTPIVFVFGEVLPKNLARRGANTFMPRVAGLLLAASVAVRATGAVAFLKGLARLVARVVRLETGTPLTSLEPRQQILVMLREGVGAGVLSDQQSAIAERVMNLSDVRVRSVMIPRARVQAIRLGASREEFTRLARSHAYSRIPVLLRPDRVVGILNVLDVLGDDQGRSIEQLMTYPMYVAPDESVTAVLATMRHRGFVIAIVNDRQGHFLGMVTLKDLVEEIVGDLEAW